MDEFSLIDTYFKPLSATRSGVVLGIGDDAACLQIPSGKQLLVSTDTLVADVHFSQAWDAYDIAYKAVMVNVSDIAAMGGAPCWVSLAMTIPELDPVWLKRFSQGLKEALNQYSLILIGGDTTRGPLSLTLTIHGLVSAGKAVRRSGAQVGDLICVSGPLGGAAYALDHTEHSAWSFQEKANLMKRLLHPRPRVDLIDCLQQYATSAIDLSDGLSSDLIHICEASQVGACLFEENIPIVDVLKQHEPERAIHYALSGGDDYELCFTVSPKHQEVLLKEQAREVGIREFRESIYFVGVIEALPGLRLKNKIGEVNSLSATGYKHF